MFDRTLSYISHVSYLKTNCLKALDISKVVGHTDWGADQKTLLCLYPALVRSKLDLVVLYMGQLQTTFQRNWTPSITKADELLLELFVPLL